MSCGESHGVTCGRDSFRHSKHLVKGSGCVRLCVECITVEILMCLGHSRRGVKLYVIVVFRNSDFVLRCASLSSYAPAVLMINSSQ